VTTGERILVATDLSAHGDRALDRAIALARDRGAHLVVLHVLETFPLADHAAMLRRDISADLGATTSATIRIERGDPAEVIERVAAEERCHIIVVGASRSPHAGARSLGRTTRRLLRRAEVPVLIASERPRGPYGKVAVAADFSDVTAVSAVIAAAVFPRQPITLIHAYQPLTYGHPGRPDGHVDRAQSIEYGHALFEQWLAASGIATGIKARLHVEIELGDPVDVLHEAAAQHAFDVLVVGTRGHGWLFELLLGSVARRIVAELSCDVLFVRAPSVPLARRGQNRVRSTHADMPRVQRRGRQAGERQGRR
jgi:nucleotide-binding universal stress UspA family protein